jgi:anti-sigma factor RsiW
MSQEFHLSDQELLQALDGELTPRETHRAQSHLASCWACRARRQEMETAIGEFIRLQRGALEDQLPSAEGPRALLKAQLAELGAAQSTQLQRWLRGISERLGWVAIALAVMAPLTYLAISVSRRSAAPPVAVTVPNPALTPGATVLLSDRQVCEQTSMKNKLVSVTLQRRVFAEYGIGTAEPGAYEVDYLITPALGGADDIRNLWPESRRATVWNAQVKDALEDHLRELVCDRQLDLATAQREIAGNWIEAYKKYFHTNRPLGEVR